ncbi:hypothetical protein UFOVP328_366 [uncultured Caudovirales phage]|uniref:Uncharacterized protein n=1 Tax=uncultured Caudovirales phage TaxID=2100421 RepID=A0A6J5LYH1_9CAUD|nr:hypothetical protein UFOVP328_366 [uncultured Caudovirales phage]
MTDKKPKIIFEPGCFDNLDVSQDELDEIVTMLTELAESGELEANSRVLTDDDIEAMDDDEIELLFQALNREPRKLQ